MSESLYTPSPWAVRVHNTVADEIFCAGAAGPGKSTLLRADILPQVLVEHQRCSDPNHPHHIAWGESAGWALHLRRKMSMLEQTIKLAKILYTRVDPGFKFSGETGVFSSGYRITFGHCYEDDSHETYMSSEFTHIAFDELVQFNEEQYTQIIGRCRTADPVLINMLRVISASNPHQKREGTRVKDPLWVRRRFVDPHREGNVMLEREIELYSGEKVIRKIIFIPARLSDNPDPVFRKKYEAQLRAMRADQRRALMEGDWYSVPNSFFGSEWNKDFHECKPFKVPREWKHFRAMDWGFRSHGCVLWFALDPDGTLYVHREFYFRMLTEAQVAKRIIEIEEDMGLSDGRVSTLTGPADTQLWERRGDTGISKAAMMQKKGVKWLKARKGPGSRQTNAERVMKRIMDHNDFSTPPGLIVFSNCKNLLEHLLAIMPDSNCDEVPDEDYKEDHAIDTIFYGAEYADRRAKTKKSPKQKDDDGDDDEGRENKVDSDDRGQYGYGN